MRHGVWLATVLCVFACRPVVENDLRSLAGAPVDESVVEREGLAATAVSVDLDPARIARFGTNVFPSRICTQKANGITTQDIDKMAEAGFDCVRITVNPVAYNADRYRDLTLTLWKHGMMPVYLFMSNNLLPPRTDAEIKAFADGAVAVAAHIKSLGSGRAVFEIWNEPNGKWFWYTGPNATEYARFADIVATRFVASSSYPIMAPGAGATLTPKGQAFLAAILKSRPSLAKTLTSISIHPYDATGKIAPENEVANINWAAGLVRNAGGTASVAVAEWGWSTCGGATVPAATQSAFMQRHILLGYATGSPILVNYTWQDEEPNRCFGINDVNGAPRKSYWDVKALLTGLRGWTYAGRLSSGSGGVWALVFRKSDGSAKVAAWITSGTRTVTFPGQNQKKLAIKLTTTPSVTAAPSGF